MIIIGIMFIGIFDSWVWPFFSFRGVFGRKDGDNDEQEGLFNFFSSSNYSVTCCRNT